VKARDQAMYDELKSELIRWDKSCNRRILFRNLDVLVSV
jgi:hypothetical protein